jgi:Abnormal spindle-like microcephaly-assoc'd, ASPM-SPD-2-Hydin
MKRVLLALTLWLCPLYGQLAVSVIGGGTEQPLMAQYNMGSVAAGDSTDIAFRLKNAGVAIATVATLSVGGSGFALTFAPPLPATLLPGASFDFTVRFSPASAGTFSAVLRAETTFIYLFGAATPSLSVFVDDRGAPRRLDAGMPVEFGPVERGTQATRRLILENPTAQPIAAKLSVIGASFRLASEAPQSITLDPQASTTVQVLFEPRQGGSQQGEFRIDQRRFVLRGSVTEPPLPRPTVSVDWGGQQPRSGLNALVSVRFDPAPRTSGTGRLRMDFRPAGAKDDAAVLLVAAGARAIGFTVIEGEGAAQFGPTAAMVFQTGTTAGTITFTAELGEYAETHAVEIPPAAATIDSAKATRTTSGIDVQISGFDNTLSLAQTSFTFLRRDGSIVPPGAIRQDVTADFRRFFESSDAGGMFQMRAAFPVTGGAEVAGVEIELVNPSGGSKIQVDVK